MSRRLIIAGAASAAPPTEGGVDEGALFATTSVGLQANVRLVVKK